MLALWQLASSQWEWMLAVCLMLGCSSTLFNVTFQPNSFDKSRQERRRSPCPSFPASSTSHRIGDLDRAGPGLRLLALYRYVARYPDVGLVSIALAYFHFLGRPDPALREAGGEVCEIYKKSYLLFLWSSSIITLVPGRSGRNELFLNSSVGRAIGC